MAISGPQSVIAALKNRLRVFRHTEGQKAGMTQQSEASLTTQPLEEIPGTKASFEKAKEEGPNTEISSEHPNQSNWLRGE